MQMIPRARHAGSVTWRRLAGGGFEVDHALAGGGWTRLRVDTEEAAEAYASAILDTEATRVGMPAINPCGRCGHPQWRHFEATAAMAYCYDCDCPDYVREAPVGGDEGCIR